jgi:fructokinase
MEQSIFPVVCFGEVLWDILPSGPLPGGAPMNVAYHLKKLGINPALITKVGRDDYGRKLTAILSENDLTTAYFQVDPVHPTGLVYATPNEHNEVAYDIVFPSAWDFIEWEERFIDLLKEAEFLVFGSLTSRNKTSKETLHRLLDLGKTNVLDVNLRPPNYHRIDVEYLITKADILKVNIAELRLITGWFGRCTTTEESTRLLQDQFNLETVIVTLGGDGAIINHRGTMYRHEGIKVNVADTVGSGDAFLAGFIYNLLAKQSIETALNFASAIGALVATKFGACPRYQVEEVISLMTSYTATKPNL